MRLPKIKVCLKNDFKITIFLNIDIKINMIIRNLIKDANLAMRQESKLDLVLFTSYNYLLGFCKNVKIAIKRIKIRYPIFVVKFKDYDFILGQNFLNFIKFN